MVTSMVATLFVDKIAEAVIQLVLVYVVDVHRVIKMISRESSHHHAMNQSKLVDRAGIDRAMSTSILTLLQNAARNLATVAQGAPVVGSDHAVKGSVVLGDALDWQE